MVLKCRVLWSSVSLFLFSLSVLSGCAHTKPMSAEAAAACQSNALLQKYHCSLAKVEADARSNNADAEYALGYMYYYGIDTPENMSAAKLWMRRAAAQGQPQAIQALQLLQVSPTEEESLVTKITRPSVKSVAKSPTKVKTKLNRALVATPASAKADESIKMADLKKSYSIQLAATINLNRLQEYVADHHLKGKAGYYKTCIKGTVWYILIYGHYPNRTQALRAIRALPPTLKAQGPWIKPYKLIQEQVEQGKQC